MKKNKEHKKFSSYSIDKEFIRNNKKHQLKLLTVYLLTDGGLTKSRKSNVIYFTNK